MYYRCLEKIQTGYRKKIIEVFENLAEPLHFEPGELIDSDFGAKDFAYVLLDGYVKQYFVDIHGREKILFLLARGDLFGEVTMLQYSQDMVVSEAFTHCSVLKLDREHFLNLVDEKPALSRQLLTMESTKIRLLLFQIYDSAFYSVTDQLNSLLIRLAVLHGRPISEGTLIDLELTHEDLAVMLGSTRSTITRALKQLKERGILGIKNRKIFITQIDFEGLDNYYKKNTHKKIPRD